MHLSFIINNKSVYEVEINTAKEELGLKENNKLLKKKQKFKIPMNVKIYNI